MQVPLPQNQQEEYMQKALDLALKARGEGEIPIGCVIVKDNKIIAATHNTVEKENAVTGHAEMNAIKEACANINDRYLEGCHVFVTLEPCPMCAGTLSRARAEHVYIAAMDEKAGFLGSLENIATDPRLNHRFQVHTGIKKEASIKLLEEFFKTKRS